MKEQAKEVVYAGIDENKQPSMKGPFCEFFENVESKADSGEEFKKWFDKLTDSCEDDEEKGDKVFEFTGL